jgi:hypothetical protein
MGAPRGGGSLPAPAFAAPRAAAPQPAPGFGAPMPQHAAPQQPRAASGNPFAAAAPGTFTEKKVRLVIDDSAVKEDEIGRKSNTRNIVLVVIGLALGIAVGFGVGSTGAERKQFSMAVRDGKDIYAKVTAVGKTVDTAKASLKKAVETSQGGPGKTAKIDYASIEALVGLKHPFSADEFARRRYLAFPTATVDALFEYYNNINVLWKRFEALGAMTAGERKREALDKAALAADQLMASEYGLVLSKNGDLMAGGIVIVRAKPADDAAAAEKDKKKEDDEKAAPKVLVSSREGGREVERELYTGQEDMAEKFDQYVIMVDKGRSMAQLGGAANLFGELRGELMETQGLMERTLELQGRLTKELGQIATLPE